MMDYYRQQGLVYTIDGAMSINDVWDHTRIVVQAAVAVLSTSGLL